MQNRFLLSFLLFATPLFSGNFSIEYGEMVSDHSTQRSLALQYLGSKDLTDPDELKDVMDVMQRGGLPLNEVYYTWLEQGHTKAGLYAVAREIDHERKSRKPVIDLMAHLFGAFMKGDNDIPDEEEDGLRCYKEILEEAIQQHEMAQLFYSAIRLGLPYDDCIKDGDIDFSVGWACDCLPLAYPFRSPLNVKSGEDETPSVLRVSSLMVAGLAGQVGYLRSWKSENRWGSSNETYTTYGNSLLSYRDPDGRNVISVLVQQAPLGSNGSEILDCALLLLGKDCEDSDSDDGDGSEYDSDGEDAGVDRDGYGPFAHTMYQLIQDPLAGAEGLEEEASPSTEEEKASKDIEQEKLWELAKRLYKQNARRPSLADSNFKNEKFDRLMHKLRSRREIAEGDFDLKSVSSGEEGSSESSEAEVLEMVQEESEKFSGEEGVVQGELRSSNDHSTTGGPEEVVVSKVEEGQKELSGEASSDEEEGLLQGETDDDAKRWLWKATQEWFKTKLIVRPHHL